jgi:hypothetical protein
MASEADLRPPVDVPNLVGNCVRNASPIAGGARRYPQVQFLLTIC